MSDRRQGRPRTAAPAARATQHDTATRRVAPAAQRLLWRCGVLDAR